MIIDGRHIGLTPEQLAKRRSCIGGSDANYIMAGGEKLWNLWEFKCGYRDPDDLSGVLAVLMGSFTEPLNAFWYEKQSGRTVIERGLSRADPDREWMTATLDGIVVDPSSIGPSEWAAVWEAKHVGGREDRQVVLARYAPQLHHNGCVVGVGHAVLSVFEGNSGYWFEEIELHAGYEAELLDREAQFWSWVQSKTRPPDMPEVAAPVVAARSVDMSQSNSWAEHAGLWLRNKSAAKLFKSAEEGLKESVPADAVDAHGHGVIVCRSKNGALRIKEQTNASAANA